MDFATLKLGADTSALKQAEKALDDVAASATGTATAVDRANDRMDASFEGVASSSKQAAGGAGVFEKAMLEASGAANLASNVLRNTDDALGGAAAAALKAEVGFETASDALRKTSLTADDATDELLKLQAAFRESKAAGDMLMLAQLKVSDAAENLAFAQAKATTQINAARAALKAGNITLEQYFMTANEARQSVRQFEQAQSEAARELTNTSARLQASGLESRVASHHVQNLAFQFQDLGMQLATGAPPLTAFIQQGSQIAGIMGQAGIGIGGVVRELALMIARLTSAIALHPAFLGLAAAFSTAFVAFKDFQAEVGKSRALDDYVASLNLTDKEMKKLEKSLESTGGIAISFGDVMKGLGKTIADMFSGLGPVFDKFSNAFTAVFRAIPGFAADTMSALYALVVGGIDGVVKVIGTMPDVLGDLFYSGLNRVANGIEIFLNGFIQSTNTILRKLGMDTIDAVIDVPAIENKYAGAANAAGTAFTSSIKTRFTEARGAFASVGNNLSQNILDAAINRIGTAGVEIINDRVEKDLKERAAKVGTSAGIELATYLQKETGKIVTDLEANFKVDTSVLDAAGPALEQRVKDYAAAQQAMLELDRVQRRQEIDASKSVLGSIFGNKFVSVADRLEKVFTKDFPKIGDTLAKTFGELGKGLGEAFRFLGKAGAFADLGGLVADIGGLFGAKLNSKNAAVGGLLGGGAALALGASMGTAALVAVPLAILGGLIRPKNPFGDVALTATQAGAVGNLYNVRGDDSRENALTISRAFGEGLTAISQALGVGTRAGMNLGSIGFSGSQFYFNPTGGDFKAAGAMRFGSAEEAVTAAIRSAVNNGAFVGLRESTKRILVAAGDINVQANKAAQMEAVFRAMEQAADPVGSALANIDKQFRNLIEVFREAGATSSEWATLEQFYQRERKRIVEQGNAEALQAVDRARAQLTAAYDRESAALLTTLERFQRLSQSLQSFRDTLTGAAVQAPQTLEEAYNASLTAFERISAAARAGDENAIGGLVSASQSYLDAAKELLSPEDYQAAQSAVLDAVDAALAQTRTMEQLAQSQLDALNKSVEGLMTVNESVLSVRDAIKALQEAQARIIEVPAGTLDFSPMAAAAFAQYTNPAFYMGGLGGTLDGLGPMPMTSNDAAMMLETATAANEATHEELVKQNEYLRELVLLAAKQERTLREIELQGETP